MHYSLNEIIARLSLHKYFEKIQKKESKNYKEILLKRLFDIDYYGAPSGRDSFFRGNYKHPGNEDFPSLQKETDLTQKITELFFDNNYIQTLFEKIKQNIWEPLQHDTEKILLEHRKDIFGDFRYDTVTKTNRMLDNDLIKTIEILLESESKDSFIYVILLFILIAIFHEDITTQPVSIVLKEETIESILKIGFSKNNYPTSISNTLNGSITNEYNKLFVHPQYKNFKIYLYNDTGNYTSDFCFGEIHFMDNGNVTLSYQNENSTGTTKYSGKAYLFTVNELVHITLEDEATHRGAFICFHYTEFQKGPKKCLLRKGLFISTGAASENFRPFVKNIILLHKEPTQQEFVSGLLKCCDMRNGNEFIIIQKNSVNHFIDRLYEFDFMLSLSNSKLLFKQFFAKHEHNNYCFVKENEFLVFLMENFKPFLNEWERIEIILLLKSFSELPNAIYPYATPDPTFQIFR